MDLFTQPHVTFEKIAAEVDLPEDPNVWPKEVLDELFKQVPYIADFQPHVVMQRVDGERGYGFGHIEISNQSEAQVGSDPQQVAASGVRSVRVPVIIKNGKLSPFDLLVNDASKVLPLTEARLRQAIFRPQSFDITGRGPGDQSLVGQLYPPYRQNLGFAGGGMVTPADSMGKMGSALEAYLAEDMEKDAGVFDRAGKWIARKARAGKDTADQFAAKELGKTTGAISKEQANVVSKGVLEGLGETGKEVLKKHKGKLLAGGAVAAGAPVAAGAVHHKLEGDRQKQFAGDIASAIRQSKTASILQAILPTIGPAALGRFWGELEKDAGLRAAFSENKKAAAAPLKLLADHDPMSAEKVASAIPMYVHPTVLQVVRLDDGYMVKAANHDFWRPTKEVIGRGQLVERFGEKVAFAVDSSGSVTLADNAIAKETEKRAEYAPVVSPGIYKVQEGDKELIGYVIPNLVDLDGGVLPLAMFTNGSQATIQAEIFGEEAGQGVNLPEGPVAGQGFFFTIDEDGQIRATIPLTLGGSHQMGGEPATFSGETYDGRPAEVSVQPNIQEPTPMEEGKLLLPQHWRWSSMEGTKEVSLAGGEEPVEAEKESAKAGPKGPKPPPTSEVPTIEDSNPSNEPGYSSGSFGTKESSAQVWVRSSGETFSLQGPSLEKIAETEFLDFDGALFLLAGLGVDLGYGATKLAHAMSGDRPEIVNIGRYITLAEEQEKEALSRATEKLASAPSLRVNLVKEAATITDPTAVDTVLSLGFISPENIMTFVSYLPTIDDAQTKMCELLLSARLGMQDVPPSALERAVRSTEEAIEGLKVIAFQSE